MKFTIRDLLWLTVVVALGLAWGLDHFIAWHKVDDQRKAMQRVFMEAKMAMREFADSRDAERVRRLEQENDSLRKDIELFRAEARDNPPPNSSAPAPKTPKD